MVDEINKKKTDKKAICFKILDYLLFFSFIDIKWHLIFGYYFFLKILFYFPDFSSINIDLLSSLSIENIDQLCRIIIIHFIGDFISIYSFIWYKINNK